MDRHQTRIEASLLSRCSAQAAYDWLNANALSDGEASTSLSSDVSAVLERILVGRREALIDLGIARYGSSKAAINRVFKRGDVGVRCAALSNPSIGPTFRKGFSRGGWLDEEELGRIVREGTPAELQAICSNGDLDDDAIEALLKRSGVFSSLSDAQYLDSLFWLGSNPRLCRAYNDRILDGWAEHYHNRLFEVTWELTRTLPTDHAHASVLSELLERAFLPIKLENVHEILKRWRFNEEEEKNYSATYRLRTRLADNLEPDEKLLKSDDPALRASFFRRFRVYEFKNWQELIMSEPDLFDELLENKEVWKSDEMRSQLENVAWDLPDEHSGMMAPNSMRWTAERWRRGHPEWFMDEDEEYSTEPDAIIRRLEKKIDTIASSLDVDFDGYIEKPTIRRVEEKLDQLKSIEGKISYIENNLRRDMHNGDPEPSSDLEPIEEQLRELHEMIREAPYIHSASTPENTVPNWVWIAGLVIGVLLILK